MIRTYPRGAAAPRPSAGELAGGAGMPRREARIRPSSPSMTASLAL